MCRGEIQSDRFYLEDARRIQRETEVIGSRAQEIKRLLGLDVDARDLIDAAVRQAVETKTALDKFRDFSRTDPLARGANYQNLSASLQNAVKELENVVALYAPKSQNVSTQAARAPKFGANPFTPGSASGELSLEDGVKHGAISDLKRVEREMHSLQKIYQALHGQTLEQQTAIETIAGNLISAESNTTQANKQLLVATETQHRRLRWKIYVFMFALAILVIYALLS